MKETASIVPSSIYADKNIERVTPSPLPGSEHSKQPAREKTIQLISCKSSLTNTLSFNISSVHSSILS